MPPTPGVRGMDAQAKGLGDASTPAALMQLSCPGIRFASHVGMKQYLIGMTLVVLLVTAGSVLGSDWSSTFGFRTGFLVGPGEIGRDVNATGGEDLFATIGSTPIAGGEIGIGNRYFSFIGIITAGFRQISVENEYDVDFPNHGKAPARLNGAVEVHPFSPGKGRVQPYFTVGFGTLVLSVDLDNVRGQELYMLFTRSLGGGIKIRMRTKTYLYVEYLQERTSEKFPFHSFEMQIVTLGLGRRF